MSREWGYWPYYERTHARAAKNGIKAKSQRGEIGQTWWSTRFIKLLESFGLGSRLTRGRSYARSGQVMDLAVKPGLVTAKVQGSRARPYAVEIHQKALSEVHWDDVLAAMAEQALFMAKLLAGEMPVEIEDAFAKAGVSLFPESVKELTTECSCPDYANPCKHIAATFYILAEAFDEDPFLIFAFRGRSKDQTIERLRSMRSAPAEDDERSTHDDMVPQLETPPLAACLENFWRVGQRLSELRVKPAAANVPDAVLRQLGPAPVSIGKTNLVEYLAPAYTIITKRAAGLALEDDS